MDGHTDRLTDNSIGHAMHSVVWHKSQKLITRNNDGMLIATRDTHCPIISQPKLPRNIVVEFALAKCEHCASF